MKYHTGVMLEEVIKMLDLKPGKMILDGTVGGATHARQIAAKISPYGVIIALDKDEEALLEANKVLKDSECKVYIKKADFLEMDKVCSELSISKLDGILLDLGVSSHQLENKERGFSYMNEGPLDMRMDREEQFSARDLVNELSDKEITEILWKYGEERWAKKIAENIVRKRNEMPIETTGDLVEIIKDAIPIKARVKGPHPAKRSFQAFRIYVNQEIEKLSLALDKGIELLGNDGRFAVISFHSLEDRIIKNKFKEFEKDCFCPPKTPKCICGGTSIGRVLTRKPLRPSKEELEINYRARSAKLRVFLKESSKR